MHFNVHFRWQQMNPELDYFILSALSPFVSLRALTLHLSLSLSLARVSLLLSLVQTKWHFYLWIYSTFYQRHCFAAITNKAQNVLNKTFLVLTAYSNSNALSLSLYAHHSNTMASHIEPVLCSFLYLEVKCVRSQPPKLKCWTGEWETKTRNV